MAVIERVDGQQATAGPQQLCVVAQRHGRIEDVVEGAAIDDEVGGGLEMVRERTIEVVEDFGAFVGAGIECLHAADAECVEDGPIGHDLAVTRQAMDGGPVDLDGAGVDGMPMGAQLSRKSARGEICRLPANEENVALDGPIRVLTSDGVNRVKSKSHA